MYHPRTLAATFLGRGARQRSTRVGVLLSAIIATSLLVAMPSTPRPAGAQAVGSCAGGADLQGSVFRDYGANGYRDPGEPGEDGVRTGIAGDTPMVISAYDSSGNVSTTTVAPDGTWSLNYPAGYDEMGVRIELTNIPDWLEAGVFGQTTPTTVSFIRPDDGNDPCGIEIGVNNPNDYCGQQDDTGVADIDVGTTCSVWWSDNGDAALVNYKYDPNTALDAVVQTTDDPTPVAATPARPYGVGSVWGLAWEPVERIEYLSAYVRRHSPLGYGADGVEDNPSNPNNSWDDSGTIYAYDPDTDSLTAFAVIPNTGQIDRSCYDHAVSANPTSPYGTDWRSDFGCTNDTYDIFAQVGKVGLGDIDISDDGSTLYAMNMNTQSLWAVDTATGTPTELVATKMVGDGPCTGGNAGSGPWRPFAVEVHDGLVYFGGICSAQPGDETDLAAHIYAFDPLGSTITEVFTMPAGSFAYDRGCAIAFDVRDSTCGTDGNGAEWMAWQDDWSPSGQNSFGQAAMPQPMLSDIEFDDNGDLVLGFRDRFGDQQGTNTFNPDGVDGRSAHPAGDTLRACLDAPGSTTWTLENNGSCGARTSVRSQPPDQNQNEGPGGAEFYLGDAFCHRAFIFPCAGHEETSLGGLEIVPGTNQAISGVFDPIQGGAAEAGGIRVLSNLTGDWEWALQMYTSPNNAPNSAYPGKAGGINDIEALCAPAPVEIGNYVWYDGHLDENGLPNGIQDPDEAPIAGVTVHLYDSRGSLVGTAVTDAEGQYLFLADDAPNYLASGATLGDDTDMWGEVMGGLVYGATYTVRLDNPADYEEGGPLFGYNATVSHVGHNGANNNTDDGSHRTEDDTDLRDSDGVVGDVVGFGVGGFSETQVTIGGPGANDHTLDFGFYETTEIEVTKTVDVPDGVDVSDVAFPFTIECTVPNAADPTSPTAIDVLAEDIVDAADLPDAETVIGTGTNAFNLVPGQTAHIQNLPIGATCQAVEDPPDGYAVTYADTDAATGTTSEIGLSDGVVIADKEGADDVDLETITATNAAGQLTIQKTVQGGTGSFDFDVDCVLDDETVFDTTVTVNASTADTAAVSEPIGLIPAGAVCTITETTQDGWTVMAITGDTISLEERWATATVEAGEVSAVAFTNKPTDTQLQIDKQTDGGDGTFQFSLICTNADQVVLEQTINVTTANGAGSLIPNVAIPNGADCTITEAAHQGWTLTNITASDGGTVDVAGRKANLVTKTGTTPKAVFSNKADPSASTSTSAGSGSTTSIKRGPVVTQPSGQTTTPTTQPRLAITNPAIAAPPVQNTNRSVAYTGTSIAWLLAAAGTLLIAGTLSVRRASSTRNRKTSTPGQ